MASGELRGRWALVTGASSGLGADFARGLSRRGCHCVLVARREDRLRELADELTRDHGVTVEVEALDLSSQRSRIELHGALSHKGIRIDVLINNAGFGIFDRFQDIAWERERSMIELDVIAVVHLTKLFLPGMLERGYGRILHVASTAAYQPVPYYASYAGSKSFVLSFGEALNYELQDSGVTSTVLSPGVTDTEFQRVAGHEYTAAMSSAVMESAEVARIGLDAMLKGRSSLLAGTRNKLLIWLQRLAPRSLVTRVATSFTGTPGELHQ